MPRSPQGQKRSADAVAHAAMVAQTATGENEEDICGPLDLNVHRREVGEASARTFYPAQRKYIAGIAASSRWQLGRA